MAEYIDKQAVLADLNETYDNMAGFHPQFYNGYQFALNQLSELPTADVAEVRHGRWIRLYGSKGMGQFKCSVCRSECYVETCMYEPIYAYCPNCGAKMDGGADNG